MAMKNYYEVLGLTPDVSGEEIKKAYRKLAKQYHPDRKHDDAKGDEKIKEINEAYQVLGHEEKRRIYDLMSVRAQENLLFQDADISPDLMDLFELFMNRGMRGPRRGFCKRRGFWQRGWGRWR